MRAGWQFPVTSLGRRERMTDLGPPAATSESRSIHADAETVAYRPPLPERYRVLKVAPTPFFADYGCHVRILEEAIALQRHRSEVRICTYPSGRDVAGVSTVRSLAVPGGA